MNNVGATYEALARGDAPEVPSRRRGSTFSPANKRPSPTTVGRSPSPTKGAASAVSPVSPGGSSGFSSRRSSQDGFQEGVY